MPEKGNSSKIAERLNAVIDAAVNEERIVGSVVPIAFRLPILQMLIYAGVTSHIEPIRSSHTAVPIS